MIILMAGVIRRFFNWCIRHLSSIFIFILILASLVVSLWAYSFGMPHFDDTHAISIYGSIIQGMSALLGIIIALFAFRIESLENQRQMLQQFMLTFLLQISGYTFPDWRPEVEEGIRNHTFTDTYYFERLRRFLKTGEGEVLDKFTFQKVMERGIEKQIPAHIKEEFERDRAS
jgi:hypothetical protein